MSQSSASPAPAPPAPAPPAPAPPAAASSSISFGRTESSGRSKTPQAVARRLDRAVRRLVREQKFTLEKFRLYRKGDNSFLRDWGSIALDKALGVPGHYNRMRRRQPPLAITLFTDTKRDALQARAELRQRFYGENNNNNARVSMGPLAKWQARFAFGEAARFLGKGFRFIKYLAAGGQGMVSLWEWQPGGGQTHRVVIKTSVMTAGREADNSGLIKEKLYMTKLYRAPHIVPIFSFKLNKPQFRSRRLEAQYNEMTDAIKAYDGMLCIEFARFGDLHGLLNKAANASLAAPQFVPKQAAWRFFDCLVKGCIAMDYPPRRQSANFGPNARPGQRWAPVSGGYLPEILPPGALNGNVEGFEGIVHFDLDPRNVFLRDYDQPGPDGLNPAHTDVPRLQIADFGLAEPADDLWAPVDFDGQSPLGRAQNKLLMWQQRNMAKPYWFLPEQFTADWEAMGLDPSEPSPLGYNWGAWDPWPVTSGPGRYSHRSNIWHIGMIMQCVMTLQMPQFPPVAGRLVSDEPAGVAYDQVPRGEQRWTYGYNIADTDPNNDLAQAVQERYDTHLCEVVARCLMNKQEHRPNLQELQDWITAELTPPAVGRPPADSAAAPVAWGWKYLMFGNPPVPTAPVGVTSTGIKNSDIDPFWDYARGRPR